MVTKQLSDSLVREKNYNAISECLKDLEVHWYQYMHGGANDRFMLTFYSYHGPFAPFSKHAAISQQMEGYFESTLWEALINAGTVEDLLFNLAKTLGQHYKKICGLSSKETELLCD